MKTIMTLAAAGLLALSTVGTANACGVNGKTAEVSKPVKTAIAPIMTPKPEG